MTDRISAWQCVGCGRIDGAAPCVGICRDVSIELVTAQVHDAALARLATLEGALRVIAHTTPREGEWKASYGALQALAKRALETDAG